MTENKWPAVDAIDVELRLCYEDSRRLTGANRYTPGPAAILTTAGPHAKDADSFARWEQVAGSLTKELGWPECRPLVHMHAGGAELVIPCPPDRLYTATEINEFAWEVACGAGDMDDNFLYYDTGFDVHQRFGVGLDSGEFCRGIDAAEQEPVMTAMRAAAQERAIPVLADDDEVSLGEGAGSRTWSLKSRPFQAQVDWPALHRVPLALVTGSNGKTTTTRLLAAMLDGAAPQFRGRVGITSTEGVQVGGEWLKRGDYSGPGGARLVLRDKRVTAAVLETARGGILRRGLAVERADAAIITNVSADHFGEYGVDSIADLVDVKLAVSHVLGKEGTLVINADDTLLHAMASRRPLRMALFAADDHHPALAALQAAGGMTCGGVGDTLWLSEGSERTSLGDVRSMPLTLGGAAHYNIANIAAAVLAARALGMPASAITGTLTTFGKSHSDNPGRLNRWEFAGMNVLVDYAHNPDGLARLLEVSRSLVRGAGKVRLLLGQAGNRDDVAIAELAATAAAAHPDAILIKELPTMLRGREPGEVPRLLQEGLLRSGFAAERIAVELDEVAAAHRLLDEAAAGDVIVLPVHQSKSRQVIADLLDAMAQSGWRPGS